MSQFFNFDKSSHPKLEDRSKVEIYVDNCLNWNEQINTIASNINSACFAILRKKEVFLANDVILSIYYSLDYSYLIYGIILWDFHITKTL